MKRSVDNNISNRIYKTVEVIEFVKREYNINELETISSCNYCNDFRVFIGNSLKVFLEQRCHSFLTEFEFNFLTNDIPNIAKKLNSMNNVLSFMNAPSALVSGVDKRKKIIRKVISSEFMFLDKPSYISFKNNIDKNFYKKTIIVEKNKGFIYCDKLNLNLFGRKLFPYYVYNNSYFDIESQKHNISYVFRCAYLYEQDFKIKHFK